MARLTKEQQQQFKEELEYRDRIEIPDKKPAAEKKPKSAYDRIVNTVKGAGAKLKEFDNSRTGKAIRGFAYQVNSQSGLGSGNVGAGTGKPRKAPSAPRSRKPTVQYIRTTDSQQPARSKGGKRIYIIEGEMVGSTKGRDDADTQQQHQATQPGITGGLGRRDLGLGSGQLNFGNDHL